MDKNDIKSKIKENKAQMSKLVERSENSQDITEVRSIGETLKTLRDEINDLENQLNDDESASRENIPEGAQLRNAEAVKLGNFSTATMSNDNIALRSDETMLSRIKGDKTPLDFGKYVRGIYTGNWENAEAEKRAVISTQGMGVLIPDVITAQIIDEARNVSLFASAGVPTYPMTDSNTLRIARVSKSPVFSFKAEGEKSEDVSLELDSVNLEAKTCYGYAYVSIEAIESARNLREIITRSFAEALAVSIDKGILYGQAKKSGSGFDDYAPAGIMNDTHINKITATNNGYSDFIKGIGTIRKANGNPSILGINADTEEYISLLVDDNGQPLTAPKSFDTLTQVVSNQLEYNETAGSDALIFDPNALAIGIQNNMRFRIITDTDKCVENGLVCFQIYSMLDSVAVRPKHICKITGIGAHSDDNE